MYNICCYSFFFRLFCLSAKQAGFFTCVFPFFRFDVGHDNFIDLEELKRMMELLGAPQTHLTLKDMIKEVDEDNDKKISFREVGENLI